MKFTVAKKSLVEALASCLDVAKRATNTIAGGVLIDGSSGGLCLTAIAAPLSIRVMIDGAAVAAAGAFVVNAEAMLERAKAMPDGDMSVVVNGTVANVSGATKRRYAVNVIDPRNFPEFPERPGTLTASAPAAALRGIIERVAYATHAVGRPILAGAYVSVGDGTIGCAATDGVTVAAIVEDRASVSGGGEFFVTSDAYRSVVAVASSEGASDVYTAGRRVQVVCGNREVDYLLPDGQKPPLFDILRQQAPPIGAEIDRSALLAAAKAVALGAHRDYCPCCMTFAGGELTMTVRSEIGVNSESLPCDGDLDVTVWLNASLLATTLAQIDCDTVTFGVNDGNMVAIMAPGVLAAIGKMLDPGVAGAKAA